MIDCTCSMEKEFNELICMNLRIVLFLIVNEFGSCHSYVCGLLTRGTKDSFLD